MALLKSVFAGFGLALVWSALGFAAQAKDDRSNAARGIKLAWDSNCASAMPLLDEAMRDGANAEDVKRQVSYAGVMCSMVLNQQVDALSFLAWLQQHYAADPDTLFLAANVFSELSDRNAKQLMTVAPSSAQMVHLNAQNFERHGNFESAIEEYRVLLKREPSKPGIHYRIGGLLLAGRITPETTAQARREFEEELKLDPRAAGAEYYLGDLDRQDDKLPQAIEHFSKAVAVQPEFADAQLGLGRSMLDSGKAAEAVSPLEKAAKLAPANPAVHAALANAYQRLGRKDEAKREFDLQKTTSRQLHENGKALQKNVDGVNAPGKQ